MGDNSLGIAGGLIPGMATSSNGLVSDSTRIPIEIRAIMAKRKTENKDVTPAWSQADALKAINEGYKGMSQAQRDSIASKFDHNSYIKHLDELGMQVVPKPKP